MHPEDVAEIETRFAAASATGEPYEVEYRFRRADGAYRWHLARVGPMRDPGGTVTGWAGTAIDIDDRRRLMDERSRLATVVEHSPHAVVGITLDGEITIWNAAAERLYGYTANEILGRSLLLLLPGDRVHEFATARERLQGDEVVPPFETVRLHKDGSPVDVTIAVSAIRDGCGRMVGIAAIYLDRSSEVAARVEQQRRERHLALMASVGTALASQLPHADQLHRCAEAIVAHLDAAFARIWVVDQIDPTLLVLRASAGLYTHLDGTHSRIPIGQWKIGRIASDRRPHLTNAVVDDPQISDQAWAMREGMVAFAGYPLLVGDELVGVFGLFARDPLDDSTLIALGSVADALAVGIERARAEAAREDLLIREAEAREEAEAALSTLATVNRVGHLLTSELDLDQLVQAVTDAGTELTRAQFGAFFYNLVNERGESYSLYTLSGAPREAFTQYPMPRATAIFGPTFRGEGPVRLADVRCDSRYGENPPYDGLPPGHLPVVSYLAVPVIARSGTVLGGLFFGHPDPGIFDQRAEDLAVGLAAHAAVAIDNAHLFREAQAAERRYRGLVEGVADAILVADEERRYSDVNVAATKLLGYSREELLNMRVEDITVAEPAWTESEFERFRRDGIWRGELEVRRKDGTTLPVEALATVVDLPPGPVHISALRDISERKQFEHLQRDFLAMVTHDLRTPLTGARAFAQLLKRRQEYHESAVHSLLGELDRMARLVNDLADVVRMEGGRLELRRSPCDLVALAHQQVESLAQRGSTDQIRVEAPAGPVVGDWDGDRVAQILQNLLGNAVEHAPGSAVIVRVDWRGDEACLSVSDQGPGIDPEHLPLLFERFYRADATGAGGLGMGLYITRMLVEAHDGRIWAESTQGKGSTFVVTLPPSCPSNQPS